MQFNQIIKNCNKIVNVNDVLNNLDLISDIVKEDVFRITKSKGIFFADFEFTYANAVTILKNQLKKSHLKAIKRFIHCKNIENATSWLIQRIISNMRNISKNNRYKLYCEPKFCKLHENIESENDYQRVIELIDLEKVDSKTMILGLQKVWEDLKYDQDFDYEDFAELCCKFGYTPNAVVGSHALEEPQLSRYQVEIGQFQLKLLF